MEEATQACGIRDVRIRDMDLVYIRRCSARFRAFTFLQAALEGCVPAASSPSPTARAGVVPTQGETAAQCVRPRRASGVTTRMLVSARQAIEGLSAELEVRAACA